MKPVLADTGVIVALLDRSERRHARCVTVLESIKRPLVTCEAVIAESCYLLRGLPGASETVLQNVEHGLDSGGREVGPHRGFLRTAPAVSESCLRARDVAALDSRAPSFHLGTPPSLRRCSSSDRMLQKDGSASFTGQAWSLSIHVAFSPSVCIPDSDFR